MALAEAELKQVVDHIRANLYDMLLEVAPRFDPGYLQLQERFIRLEEELKSQRELMAAGFAAVDKRFEAVDKRFEDLSAGMNKRFEAVDKRFEDMHKRFTGLQWIVIAGFVVIGSVLSIFGFLAQA